MKKKKKKKKKERKKKNEKERKKKKQERKKKQEGKKERRKEGKKERLGSFFLFGSMGFISDLLVNVKFNKTHHSPNFNTYKMNNAHLSAKIV